MPPCITYFCFRDDGFGLKPAFIAVFKRVFLAITLRGNKKKVIIRKNHKLDNNKNNKTCSYKVQLKSNIIITITNEVKYNEFPSQNV